ncbi:MAG TPA: retropepsin-like aspartic protease [Acidobacteriota bacterium]|nr:retropepsin-like aspartic protease [Acidobacteriota bacterium]HQM62694.1 retropepsin-like aspartic protease [Acidobacteriota bacterium]
MRRSYFVQIAGLLVGAVVFCLGDVVVYRNGSRLEVQDLKIGDQTISYSIKGMTATVPVRYIDVEATRQANAELEAERALKAEAEAEAAARRRETEAAAPLDAGGAALGDMARRSLSDADVQKLLDKWVKRHADKSREEIASAGPGGMTSAPVGAFRLPFYIESGVMMIHARVNDQDGVPFCFDTGASWTTVTPELVRRAGIPVDFDTWTMAQTGNGMTKVYLGMVDRLVVGDLEVRNLPVTVAENCTVNLLGQNLLQNFKVSFDYQARVITLAR